MIKNKLIMNNHKDLEMTLREKVSPLLADMMQKNLGLFIPKIESDITDQLKRPYFYVSLNVPFQQAKKQFQSLFIQYQLRVHQGNISRVALSLGLTRRSLHRLIRALHIEVRMFRHHLSLPEIHLAPIDQMLRVTLDAYKTIFKEDVLHKMYQEIPRLSQDIVQLLPQDEITWKEAEIEFEKQFITYALMRESKIHDLAQKMGMRPETLSRKVHKWGLRQNI